MYRIDKSVNEIRSRIFHFIAFDECTAFNRAECPSASQKNYMLFVQKNEYPFSRIIGGAYLHMRILVFVYAQIYICSEKCAKVFTPQIWCAIILHYKYSMIR